MNDVYEVKPLRFQLPVYHQEKGVTNGVLYLRDYFENELDLEIGDTEVYDFLGTSIFVDVETIKEIEKQNPALLCPPIPDPTIAEVTPGQYHIDQNPEQLDPDQIAKLPDGLLMVNPNAGDLPNAVSLPDAVQHPADNPSLQSELAEYQEKIANLECTIACKDKLIAELQARLAKLEQSSETQGKKTDAATITKLKNSLSEWKSALPTMLEVAFMCAVDGEKERSENDIRNLVKRTGRELSRAQIDELRSAWPAGHVLRKEKKQGVAG